MQWLMVERGLNGCWYQCLIGFSQWISSIPIKKSKFMRLALTQCKPVQISLKSYQKYGQSFSGMRLPFSLIWISGPNTQTPDCGCLPTQVTISFLMCWSWATKVWAFSNTYWDHMVSGVVDLSSVVTDWLAALQKVIKPLASLSWMNTSLNRQIKVSLTNTHVTST